MIITETIAINNKDFTKNYSDAGYCIKKVDTEEIYSEAIDPIDSGRTYIETDKLIENTEIINENEATISDYQDALGEFGVKI
jgi:hypothetical protein